MNKKYIYGFWENENVTTVRYDCKHIYALAQILEAAILDTERGYDLDDIAKRVDNLCSELKEIVEIVQPKSWCTEIRH